MNENDSTLPGVGTETRLQKFARGALRWVLVALLAFGVGALIITFTLYNPTRQKLDKANTDLGNATADDHQPNRSDHRVADG